MDAAIIGRIALETAMPESSVAAAAALFEKGATGSFIVHYRKEITGGLDEGKIRSIQERIAYYKEIWDQRAALLKMMSEQEKLTEELQKRIESCFSKAELDDLHHQFRPRRKTRAIDAAEKGLEPLAEYFWNQELDAWSVEEHIDVFVDPAKGISTREQALQGIVDIIAEWIWANIEYRKALRDMLWSEGSLISSVVPAKVGQKTKYNMYYDRRESVTTIPSHRVLAIRRGCKEGILISSIEGDNSKSLEFLLDSIIKDKESIFAPVLEAAVRESYSRLLRPLIETEVRTQLKERADREAIKVFQENLANLLLSPPAGPIVVMGIDYGKGNECNVAVIDEAGKFLEGAKIRFASASENASAKGKKETPPPPSPDSRSAKAETPTGESTQEPEVSSADSASDDTGTQSEAESSAPAQEQPTSTESVSSDPSTPDASDPEASATTSEKEAPPSDPGPGEVEMQPETDNSDQTQEQSSEPASAGTASSESPALEDGKEKESEQTLKTETPQTDATEAPAIAESAAIADPPATEPLNAPDVGLEPEAPKAEAEPVETSQDESGAAAAEAAAVESPDATAAENASAAAESESEPSQPAENEPAATDAAPAEESEESASKEAPPVEETTGIAAETDESAAETAGVTPEPEPEVEDPATVLKALIAKHNIKAISIGIGTGSRQLETTLRQIVQEDGLSDIMIAAVNDAGIAIYSSSRIAREEFPDWSASARCAVSLARRLQDPLAELVKIDPKLIGVGQYQHDVDQKALHRGLLQTVQYCVNKVGVNVNTASESLLRYVSGLNDKLARRLVAHRNAQGPFSSRDSIMSAVGMDEFAYQQAAAFLRIPDGENKLDRTAVHPESYPAVEKMAAALEVEIDKLIGNKERISSLKLEDFATETTGLATLNDIREELLRPGRDPRKAFRVPKFRTDVKEMSDLKPGMALEGTVTNVTNFGAFVDIGVRQDGLVHLSQMSNRFIRDPREAVKVGDVVQVKVISIEPETKRIGLSMKAMLPTAQRRRKKQRRNARRQGAQSEGRSGGGSATGDGGKHSKSNKPYQGSSRNRRRGGRKQGNSEASQQKDSNPKTPEPTLQEKIAILQSKFRRIN